MLPSEEGDQPN